MIFLNPSFRQTVRLQIYSIHLFRNVLRQFWTQYLCCEEILILYLLICSKNKLPKSSMAGRVHHWILFLRSKPTSIFSPIPYDLKSQWFPGYRVVRNSVYKWSVKLFKNFAGRASQGCSEHNDSQSFGKYDVAFQ